MHTAPEMKLTLKLTLDRQQAARFTGEFLSCPHLIAQPRPRFVCKFQQEAGELCFRLKRSKIYLWALGTSRSCSRLFLSWEVGHYSS